MPDPNSNIIRPIEIDSVLKEVGNKRFWDFIIYQLTELFPTRDYNRATDVDEVASIYTPEMFELQSLVIDMVRGVPQCTKAGITPASTRKVCQTASGGIIKIPPIRIKESSHTLPRDKSKSCLFQC